MLGSICALLWPLAHSVPLSPLALGCRAVKQPWGVSVDMAHHNLTHMGIEHTTLASFVVAQPSAKPVSCSILLSPGFLSYC